MSLAVIVPAYNEKILISKSLNSLMAQTHKPDEVIVVDDDSTDQTFEIASRYPVTVVTRKKTGGYDILGNYTKVLKFGYDLLKNKHQYIAILDADTELKLDYYEILLKTSGWGITGGSLVGVKSKTFAYKYLGLRDFVYGCNRVYTKETWDILWRLTPLNYNYHMGIDTYHSLLALNKGIDVCFNPDAVSIALRPPIPSRSWSRGVGSYALGYYWWYAFARAIVNHSPNIALGYIWAYLRDDPQAEEVKPLVQEMQRERLKRIIGKLGVG
jgi:glycosyltransferase involved in cell wall biosynthesis